MEKIRAILFLCFINFIFIGCGEKATPVELEILIYNKIAGSNSEKYPKSLQDICQPFIAVGDNKTDYSLTPISVKRIDLNKKFEIDYLGNKAGNPSKIKFVQRELKNYFEDSFICELLTLPNGNISNIQSHYESIKNKNNCFVFSSDESLAIDGKVIYHSIGELRNAISKYLIENKDFKIFIEYEPQNTNSEPGEDDPLSTELDNIFRQMTDLNVSPDERSKLIPIFLSQSFASNSTIEEFGENKGIRVGIKSTEVYFNEIVMSRSISKIEIMEAKKNQDGKYWTIKIIEHHKLSN